MKKFYQPFHLVSISPWPIITSFSILSMMIMMINWFNNKIFYTIMLMFLILLTCMFMWWRDTIRESMIQGFHSFKVMNGLKLSMLLFITSELFFFISIFWCYLHMFLSPSIEMGNNWPPKSIIPFNPYLIPLLNTLILISSGISITWCHYSLINNKKKSCVYSMFITIFLGIIFTLFQFIEYFDAKFNLSDSVFGSIFFLGTGFHGLHVLIGSSFLLINLIRIIKNNYSMIHHLGFEFAAWYWHFVDVVWLFLFLLFYFFSY